MKNVTKYVELVGIISSGIGEVIANLTPRLRDWYAVYGEDEDEAEEAEEVSSGDPVKDRIEELRGAEFDGTITGEERAELAKLLQLVQGSSPVATPAGGSGPVSAVSPVPPASGTAGSGDVVIF
jgi:hypothetical protein